MEYFTKNDKGILIYPGKRKLLFEIKKGELKNKILLKMTILEEKEHSVQLADRTKAVQG